MEHANTNKIYIEIGKRIKDMREHKNISQEELSKKIGLTRTSITNIEKGRQRLLVHTLINIAQELSINVNTLLPSFEEPFNKVLNELSDTHKRTVQEFLKEGGG
jgi:transcriptional regulator with XRE-family HTH domain